METGNALVSVIMPAYNAHKYIENAIMSVIGQEYENWELVITNDGSTDETVSIVEKYVNQYPEKIRLYHNPKNMGVSAALNSCLRHAKGEYVCWLSADDMYLGNMVSSGVSYLTDHPEYGAVFSKPAFADKDDKIIGTWENMGSANLVSHLNKPDSKALYYMMFMDSNLIAGCSVLARRSVFEETGFFDESNLYSSDYEYWLRMLCHTDMKFLDEYYTVTRIHDEQCSLLGNNDVCAIAAFVKFINNKELLPVIIQKAGLEYSRKTVASAFIERMRVYNHVGLEKELVMVADELVKYMSTDGI